jgi:uncharacterized protein (TIGR00251 family)
MSPSERVKVRLTPKASKNEVVGAGTDGVVKIKVMAPPTEGAANRALVRFLAKRLGVSTSNVRIVGGSKSRDKVVEVVGAEQVQQKLLSED